jgi:ABC-type branched-subunit amino acid transport system permease subunit
VPAVIQDLLPFVVTGLSTGSVFALAAMGLVLTYKTSGVFSFAHGAQAALGAYIMWDLWEREGWPWPIAAAAAIVLAGIGGGLLLERAAFLLADKPVATKIAASVGMLVALQALIVLRYDAATIPMRYFLPIRTVRLLGVNIRYEQFIVFGLALGAAVGLSWFFRRSRVGIAMQGVVDDPTLLALQGVSPIEVRRQSWMIGACFAAASGALLAPSLGLDATLLTLLVVQAFGAAAIGRFSSLWLTYVGGLAVGVGQEVLKYAIGQDWVTERVSGTILQPLPNNLPFVILFVALLVTKREKLIERGSRVVRRDRPLLPMPRPVTIALVVGGTVLGLFLPALVDTRLPAYTTAVAFAILFVSLHLLVRVSGQVSLCHMSFAAIGAAAYAHAMQGGVPFAASLLFAGLVAVPVGAFVAIPAIRLPGVYLAIATFGFGILVERVVLPIWLLFGARQTVSAARPSFAEGDRAYYYLVLAVAVACCGLAELVRRGRLGRLLQGTGDAPDAVAAHGASIPLIRAFAFCVSAFLAGIAGALIGPITGSATAGTFGFGISLTLLAVLFVAGRRPIVSAFIAAGAYIVGPTYISGDKASVWVQVVFGAAAVAVACGAPAAIGRAWTTSPRLRARVGARTPAAARLVPGGEA